MKKRVWLVACSLAALTCVGGLGSFLFLGLKSSVSKAEMERRVESEIPLGTSRADVLNWILANGYSNGQIANGESPRKTGFNVYFYQRKLWYESKVTIFLVFDENDKLDSAEVEERPRISGSAFD
jgi:hypothetical protein